MQGYIFVIFLAFSGQLKIRLFIITNWKLWYTGGLFSNTSLLSSVYYYSITNQKISIPQAFNSLLEMYTSEESEIKFTASPNKLEIT